MLLPWVLGSYKGFVCLQLGVKPAIHISHLKSHSITRPDPCRLVVWRQHSMLERNLTSVVSARNPQQPPHPTPS